MVEGKLFAPGQDITPVLAVRNAALGIQADGLDQMGWQALIYSDGEACATGRIRYNAGAYVLEHLCVLPGFDQALYGDVLIRLLLYKAQQHNAPLVRLYCKEDEQPFYLSYGFKPDRDSLLIKGDTICLDTCSHCGKCGKSF